MKLRDEIERKIFEFFAENFELLRLEAGHSLAPEAKTAAFLQALFYWRRLREVAEKVTDTEVKLNLPEQATPKGRKFGIEGVVDIVRELDRTVMYDIKTHEADDVRANLDEYEKQLNVYAHIWQNLRKQALHETAVISTAFPEPVKASLTKSEVELQQELQKWNPLIPIPFDTQRVQETIREFGQVVDNIEDGQFAPPPLGKLKSKAPGMKVIFAVQVCRNCDARFSCTAYRQYAATSRGAAESTLRQFFFDDFGAETEREERVIAALDEAQPIEIGQ